jgi:hypothetical protein
VSGTQLEKNLRREGPDFGIIVGHGSENAKLAKLDVVEGGVCTGAVDFEEEVVVRKAVEMGHFANQGHMAKRL